MEYEQSGQLKTKSLDLLDLNPEQDAAVVAEGLSKTEPLITKTRLGQVEKLIKSIFLLYFFKVLGIFMCTISGKTLIKNKLQ